MKLKKITLDNNKTFNDNSYDKQLSEYIDTLKKQAFCLEIDQLKLIRTKSIDNKNIWNQDWIDTEDKTITFTLEQVDYNETVIRCDYYLDQDYCLNSTLVAFCDELTQDINDIRKLLDINFCENVEHIFDKKMNRDNILSINADTPDSNIKNIHNFFNHFINFIDPEYLPLKEKEEILKNTNINKKRKRQQL